MNCQKYKRQNIKKLLETAETQRDQSRLPSLHYSVQHGSLEDVRDRIEWHDDPIDRCFGPREDTALMLATRKADKSKVLYLLDKGANINQQNFFGKTSLCIAVSHGHFDIAKTLISRGADTNLGNPLSIARFGENERMVELLLKNGALSL